MEAKSLIKGIKRVMWSIITIGAGVFILLSALMYIFQERFIYVPHKEIEMDPSDMGIKFEDLSLTASDGTKIHTWFIPAENAAGTVLFCHGNAGNISHRLETIKIFHDLKMNFIIFDYRGYGRSKGVPSEKGTYLDSAAVWDFLTKEKKIPPEKIIIVGRSLGGGIAAHLAKDKGPAGLVLESAFISIPEVGRDFYPFLPVKLLCRIKYKTAEYLKEVKCPKLIMHSPEDEIINFRHGRTLFEKAPEPKKFIQLSGSHNDCYFLSHETYTKELKSFMNKCLKEKVSQ